MSHDQSAHSATGQRWIDVLPESFWVAGAQGQGGFAGLGFVIDMTAAMNERKESSKGENVKMIESVGEGERWYEKLEDSFHVHVESLSPPTFLADADRFLNSVGLDGLTQISVNEEAVPRGQTRERMDLKRAVEVCSDFLSKNEESVRTMEITSHGSNERFSFLVDFSYRRKHRPVVPPIELEVQAMSNELGPKKGEPFSDYRARMNALDADPQRRREVYDQIEDGKKAMFSDFAHHLSEAFPGVKLQFYERLAPGES